MSTGGGYRAKVRVRVDGQDVTIGHGIVGFEWGILLSAGAAERYKKLKRPELHAVCGGWTSLSGSPTVQPDVRGVVHAAVGTGLKDYIGINLDQYLPASYLVPVPPKLTTAAEYFAYLQRLIDPPIDTTGADEPGTPGPHEEPPIGGPKSWWCSAFPSCWGC